MSGPKPKHPNGSYQIGLNIDVELGKIVREFYGKNLNSKLEETLKRMCTEEFIKSKKPIPECLK